MNLQRIGAIALRVIRQVLRDRRTVALLLLGPMLVLTLGAVLFRADAQNIQLGVVNEDTGMDVPMLGAMNMADRVTDELSALDTVDVISLARGEINDRLKDGTVRAVVVFAEDFSQQAIQQKQAEIDLRLEGSNPSSNIAITALVGQAAMKAMASLASGSTAETKQPVTIQSNAEGEQQYLAGACDAYTTDASGLAATRAIFADPENHIILPEIISKEPLGPLVRQGDDQWADVARWTLNALVAAEEYGVTAANADELAGSSENPEIRRLLGTEGGLGAMEYLV